MREDLNLVEGDRGTTIGIIRQVNDKLDKELRKPVSTIEERNRNTEIAIAEQLINHGWNKNGIRKALKKRHYRDELLVKTEDSYLDGVLSEAGYDPSEHRNDDDDDGVTTDSDYSEFSDITFDNNSDDDDEDIDFVKRDTKEQWEMLGEDGKDVNLSRGEKEFIDGVVNDALDDGQSVDDGFDNFERTVDASLDDANVSEIEDVINSRNNAN